LATATGCASFAQVGAHGKNTSEATPKTGGKGFDQAKEARDYEALATICADESDLNSDEACGIVKSHAKVMLGKDCPVKQLTTEMTDEDGKPTKMRGVYTQNFRKPYLDKLAACGQWDALFKGAVVMAEPDDYDRIVSNGQDVVSGFDKFVEGGGLAVTGDAPKVEDKYAVGQVLTWLGRMGAAASAPKLVTAAKKAPYFVRLSVMRYTLKVGYADGAQLARELLDDPDPTHRAKGCAMAAEFNDGASLSKVKGLAEVDPTQTKTDKGVQFPVRTACQAAVAKLEATKGTTPPKANAGGAAPASTATGGGTTGATTTSTTSTTTTDPKTPGAGEKLRVRAQR
jgi:hypothetical protein